jgi:hypothetical protein
MELWTPYNLDYYGWIMDSEAAVGGISPEVLELAPNFSILGPDAYGTKIIIAFIAAANLKTPLLGAAPVTVTMLVWIGLASFSLLKKCFNFRPLSALAVTLFLVSGALFNYIGLMGMFGHMTAVLGFLAALELLTDPSSGFPPGKLTVKLFFPLFLIFLAYQAGYVLYAAMAAAAGLMQAFFSQKNRHLLKRLGRSFAAGAVPAVLATIAAAVLMPAVFLRLFFRTFGVAAQVTGWDLPFLSPWHFSGLPFYAPGSFNPFYFSGTQADSVFPFLILMAAAAGLLIIVLRPGRRGPGSGADCPAGQRPDKDPENSLKTLTVLYLVSAAGYLILYSYFGNAYKIWKLAALTLLPLSFVPLALTVKVLERLAGPGRPGLPPAALLILAAGFGIKFSAMPPLTEFPYTYYNCFSAEEFVSGMKNLRNNLPKRATVLFDFTNIDSKFISAIVFGNKLSYQTRFLTSFVVVRSSQNIFNLLSEDLFFVTDKKFGSIINNNNDYNNGNINIYSYNEIIDRGMVSFHNGLPDFKWEICQYPVHFTILIPKNKKGQPLKLSAALAPAVDLPPDLSKVRLGLIRSGKIEWTEANFDQLAAEVPAEWTENGFLKAVLAAGPRLEPEQVQTNNQNIGGACYFKLLKVNLE